MVRIAVGAALIAILVGRNWLMSRSPVYRSYSGGYRALSLKPTGGQ